MDDLLAMDEIERRYAGEWVVLTEMDTDPGPVINRARVSWHGTDRDAAWDFISALPRPLSIGVFFMGPVVDDDVALVL